MTLSCDHVGDHKSRFFLLWKLEYDCSYLVIAIILYYVLFIGADRAMPRMSLDYLAIGKSYNRSELASILHYLFRINVCCDSYWFAWWVHNCVGDSHNERASGKKESNCNSYGFSTEPLWCRGSVMRRSEKLSIRFTFPNPDCS